MNSTSDCRFGPRAGRFGLIRRSGEALGNRPQSADRFGTGAAGFVIFGVLVYGPHVVQTFSRGDVFGGEHGGHHRVVLVVVLVHPVAAHQVQVIAALLQSAAHRIHMAQIGIVVHGVRLLLADHAAVGDVGG